MIWFNYIISLKMNLQLSYSLKDLKIQLLFGHNYLTVLWYQWSLILISVLFFIVIFLFKNTYYFFLILLLFISNCFIYSEMNSKIFSKYPFNRKYPLGRISESFPFCVIGFFLADIKLMKIFEMHRFKTLFFTCLFQFFFSKFNIFSNISGFGYQGIKLSIVSTLIFISFSLFPSRVIKKKKIITTVKEITSYTMGIYILHVPIGNYMNVSIINYKRISIVHANTLTSSLIIYQICYSCSYFCMKIIKKTKMKNLFS